MTALQIVSTTDTKRPSKRTKKRGVRERGRRGEVIKSVAIATECTLYVHRICSIEIATHVWGDTLDDWDQENIQEEGDGQETREC
jgi:hypothetical protein